VRSYVGVENDPILALCGAHVLEARNAPPSFLIWYRNFLTLDPDEFEKHGLAHPHVVISNPPFVRSHNLHGRARILAKLRASVGNELSSLSGSSTYFLCKAAELLHGSNAGGSADVDRRCLLFFLPKEAAGAAHSRELRERLCVRHGWRLNQYAVPNELVNVERSQAKSLALCYVFEWSREPSERRENEVARRHVLGDLVMIRRGISTGCNAFFVLSDGQAREREIPEECLRRVLPTRIPLKSCEFANADWEKYRLLGRPCWLLSLPDVEMRRLSLSVQTYLKEGVREGLHATATAERLKRWYSLPIPAQPPDFFVTYLFRGSPRFVLNSAGVLYLTNVLGAWLRKPLRGVVDVGAVVASLNDAARVWMEQEGAGREYRDGLRKIEPREMEALPVGASVRRVLGDSGNSETRGEGTLFD
jgi:hypothetical protein